MSFLVKGAKNIVGGVGHVLDKSVTIDIEVSPLKMEIFTSVQIGCKLRIARGSKDPFETV